MKRIVLALAVAASFVFGSAAASAAPITVTADYSVTSGDNTTLKFTNGSSSPLTNLVLSGTGTSGSINGQTGTHNLPNIAAGGSFTYSFDTVANTGSGNVFHFDFDDFFSGAVNYTLTGLAGGSPITITFSPSVNSSGGFVGFLGNDANGNESDATVQPTVVGSVVAAAAVPEPATMAVFGMMLVGGLGYVRRRKLARV